MKATSTPDWKRKRAGFTLVEIMITIGIIGILIAIAVPSFLRARNSARTRAIQQDLLKIDEASRLYVIEHRLGPASAMPTLAELVSLQYLNKFPTPPVLGHYEAATAYTELGVTDPAAYPRLVPDSGGLPEWVHPDLLPTP
jgi:general secretion pathway protein G